MSHRCSVVAITAVAVFLTALPAHATQPLTSFRAPKAERKADRNKDFIKVFADGSIQSFARGDSVESNPLTGSLGFELRKPDRRERWTAAITVTSNADTISSGFGVSLLNASAGRGFQSGLLDVQKEFNGGPLDRLMTRRIHAYASLARARWRDSTRTYDTALIGLGLTRYTEIGAGKLADNDIRLAVECGLALRLLAGDIGGRDNRAVRTALLGTSGRGFWGPEFGMQLAFRDVTADLHYYQLFDASKRARVEGLTTGQVVASIGIRGTILSGVLSPE